MRFQYVFPFLFLLAISLPRTGEAGRLGICKRCVTDSGIVAHLWTMSPNSFNFCESKQMNDGGDGDPRICDGNAGVARKGSQNDPFNICNYGNPTHQIWIGGENGDLIVVGNDFASGRFIPLRDGEDLNCGEDVKSSSGISAVRFGRRRDLLNIYAKDASGTITEHHFRLQDGRDHGFEVGLQFVARRYGRRGDLIAAYGVNPDGTITEHHERIQDGRDHSITIFNATDFGVTYGRNNDVRGRFCFSGGKWKVFLGRRDGGFPSSCEPPPPPPPEPYVPRPGIDYTTPEHPILH